MILKRRKFLAGVAALFVAPAIVRASSLMPIFVRPAETLLPLQLSLSEELTSLTRAAFVPRIFCQIYYATPTMKLLLDQALEDSPLRYREVS